MSAEPTAASAPLAVIIHFCECVSEVAKHQVRWTRRVSILFLSKKERLISWKRVSARNVFAVSSKPTESKVVKSRRRRRQKMFKSQTINWKIHPRHVVEQNENVAKTRWIAGEKRSVSRVFNGLNRFTEYFVKPHKRWTRRSVCALAALLFMNSSQYAQIQVYRARWRVCVVLTVCLVCALYGVSARNL